MIVSASYRTDIPAFYARWFLARLAEGRAQAVNPYGGKLYEVPLTGPAVDGYVFWTRNVAPFGAALEALAARGLPFVVQFTVTGYPRALERSVAEPARAAEQVRRLADRFGPRVAVWRYDPILISDLTPPAVHREAFARLAGAMAGATDEVTVSFAAIYRKTARNLTAAGRRHGFAWRDPDPEEKRAILADLAAIAADRGMRLTLCTQPDLVGDGAEPAACVDPVRLSDVAGRPIGAKRKGNRPGCLCAESRDIGAYDTCPHGCVYCYAVQSRDRAARAHRAHDPAAPYLGPPPGGGR
jgi:hypothetical protein